RHARKKCEQRHAPIIARDFLRLRTSIREGFVTASIEHASRAKARRESCRCDGILPLCASFGSEDPQCGSGDEVAWTVEGIVNRTVHAEEALGGSSRLEP